MADFGGINFGGDARRAHLALVEGGAHDQHQLDECRRPRALGTAPVAPRIAPTVRRRAPGSRRRSEDAAQPPRDGVRAVAKNFNNFDDALLPMVLASGVSGEAAASVADAIKGNPALKAQAERAFQRADSTPSDRPSRAAPTASRGPRRIATPSQPCASRSAPLPRADRGTRA